MRRFVSIAASLSAVAAISCCALTSSAAAKPRASAVTPTPSSGITWGPCTDPDLVQLGAECGMLSVPLDYSNPSGPQIQLAVSRLQHTSSAADYQGVMLTNPGGPGGSGLTLGPIISYFWGQEGYTGAADDYDWIGFDPRGVGSSQPALTCDPNIEGPDRAPYNPFTFGLLKYWITKSDNYAQACDSTSAAQSALLRHDTTQDSAMDMDSIRKALGQPQINYYGYSYGTYLGQVYSTLFPSHVRREVLDSNVDPRTVWYQANLDQDVAFQRNEQIWFGWLAKYDSVYHLGSTERAVYREFNRVKRQLAADPAGGVVGSDEWVDIFLEAGYYQETWLDLGQLFSEWVNNHDAAATTDLINAYESTDSPGDDNGYAGYVAVECSEGHWPGSWGRIVRDNWETFAQAPFETWANAWFNGPCTRWAAPAHTPVQIDGSGVKSALLVDQTLDAATPFPGSLEVRRLFPDASLIAEPGGTTHADTPDGDACVDGTIANYLTTGVLPPRRPNAPWDKTCAPLPQPDPTATTVAPALRSPKALRPETAPGRLGLAEALSR